MTNSPPTVKRDALGEMSGEALLRLAAQERALSRATCELVTQTDEKALLQLIPELVASLLQVDVVALFLTSEEEASTPRCRVIGLRDGVRLLPPEEAPTDAFATETLKRREPRQRRSWSAPEHGGRGSALAVPLADQDRPVGVLIVARSGSEQFREDHVSLLSAIGQHLALALLRMRQDGPLRSEVWTQELFDSIAEGLIVVDARLRTTYLNPAASEMVGLPATGALGRQVEEILKLEDDAGQPFSTEASPFARAFREDRAVTLTAQIVVGGRRTPVALTVAPMREGSGPAAHAVGMIHDCSREKEQERLRTEFVSIASHEIRTPLTALRGFTELMLSRDVPENVQRDWLSLMNQEAVRLVALLEEMGDLARFESGQISFKPSPVHLSDVVCRVVRLLDGEGKRAHVLLEEVPTVMADADKLTQVITNLLRNALDYSPQEQSVEVEVARRCLAQESGSLVVVNGVSRPNGSHDCQPAVSVAVRDQGVGMTKEELSQAFQPFYRAEASQGLLPEGSGLGLAIAKAIVDGHHGCLWAQSRAGRGSIFGFCLPQSASSLGEGTA